MQAHASGRVECYLPGMDQTPRHHLVGPADHRLRLDRYLHKVRPDLGRRQIEALLRTGNVLVNDHPRGREYFVKRGERVRVLAAGESDAHTMLAATPPRTPPAVRDPRLILRLPELLAAGKPPEMPTVPAPRRGGAAATCLLAWLQENLPAQADAHPPGVVHRLDKDTSGIVLFSLSPRAHELLVQAFRRRQAHKAYLALAAGRVSPRAGTIDLALAREAGGRMRPARAGLPARTSYTVLRAHAEWSLLRVEPLTGRMHQIRAHLAAINHPILGDPRYGRPVPAVPAPPRLWLHAWQLALPRPVRKSLGAPESIACPLWEDLAAYLETLEKGLSRQLSSE